MERWRGGIELAGLSFSRGYAFGPVRYIHMSETVFGPRLAVRFCAASKGTSHVTTPPNGNYERDPGDQAHQ